MTELKSVLKDIGTTLRTYHIQQDQKCKQHVWENRQNLNIIKEFPYVKRLLKENELLKQEIKKLKQLIPAESANINLEINEINRVIEKTEIFGTELSDDEEPFINDEDEDDNDENDENDEDEGDEGDENDEDDDDDDDGDDDDGDDEGDENELLLITVNKTKYYTNDRNNGTLFEFLFNGLVGIEVGYLKNKEPFFNKISEQ